MAAPIITIENLSKSFVISHEQPQRYRSLRDSIADASRKIFSKKTASVTREEFWALNDVSFDIQPGSRVGIIGRNGAGKSTLLKILSRITEPSKGRITINGRVASLLEVGTGFHPELTGRENIFLNGAILGMSRAEIRRKFDEIVAFAEVEKFLDTPVKRYSSGMYVRLAFAVAAHLEPEILVVDEVLAVGDAQFQKKCLGKMEDVSKNGGRTVLFVSHQMDAIETLTQTCVHLKNGRVHKIGNTREVIEGYLKDSIADKGLGNFAGRAGNGKSRLIELSVKPRTGDVANAIKQGQVFDILMRIQCFTTMALDVSLVVEDARGHAIFCTQFSDKNQPLSVSKEGDVIELQVPIDLPNLRQGDYTFSAALFRPDKTEFYDAVLHHHLITIEGLDDQREFPTDDRWGALYFPIKWQLN